MEIKKLREEQMDCTNTRGCQLYIEDGKGKGVHHMHNEKETSVHTQVMDGIYWKSFVR